MSSITLQNVTKRFGDFTAVDDLNLDIKNGEFVALLGPSGCGKTTTMNMIAGIESITEGQILFDGKDYANVSIQKRHIGFVFQNYAIFTHLTVYKNLSYGLEVTGVPKAEIERRVMEMAKRMSIEHRLDQKAGSLSVNELQKLAIGRSAVTEPQIFLLDEPLSNLDAGFRAYMRAELKVLQHTFKQTMIYVTHDQVEAMSLADRIAIIDQGKLMQYGDPLEVFNDPQNVFVANFVGSPSINLIEGDIVSRDDSVGLRLSDGLECDLSKRQATALAREPNAKRGILAIRPQDIYLGERRSDQDTTLTGTVEVIERVGPKRLAHMRLGQGVVRAVDDRWELKERQQAEIHLDDAKCLVFSADSGQRLDSGAS